MNASKAIKVACIGAGYFSQFHYDAWARIKEVRLVASADHNIEHAKATNLPAFDNAAQMLSTTQPDIVDIITPPPSHYDYIKLAIDAGVKTIICQKPFCNNLDEARKAAKLAEENSINLIIHENFRFQPWYRIMKEEIQKGTIGEVHQLTFRLRTGDGQGANAYLQRQPYFQQMEKFLIHETGVHWLDTFKYLLGEPKAIYADLRQMNPHIAGEDAGYFIMEFKNNKQAIFDANRHLDHEAENFRTTLGECLLEGTQGTISLYGNGELQLRHFESNNKKTLLEPKQWPGFAGDCVFTLQSHVISGLLNDEEFENTASEYLKILELEEAVYKSDKSGCKLVL